MKVWVVMFLMFLGLWMAVNAESDAKKLTLLYGGKRLKGKIRFFEDVWSQDFL